MVWVLPEPVWPYAAEGWATGEGQRAKGGGRGVTRVARVAATETEAGEDGARGRAAQQGPL